MLSKTVEVEMVVRVTIDETKFDPAFLLEFRRSMYDFKTVDRHIEHLGQLYARGLADNFSTFIEGYGPPKDMGISFSNVDQDQEICSDPYPGE